MQDREKISTGDNEEPINETIAGTGPGIPDNALAPGKEELPEPPTGRTGRTSGPKLWMHRSGNGTLFRWKVNNLRDKLNGRFCNRSVSLTM
jgi:hypothetical protein